MIRLHPTSFGFVVESDEPVTVSVDLTGTTFVYRGVLDDEDDTTEPVGAYDTTLDSNTRWQVL